MTRLPRSQALAQRQETMRDTNQGAQRAVMKTVAIIVWPLGKL